MLPVAAVASFVAFASLAGAPSAQQAAAPATVQLSGRVVTWQGRPVAGAAIAFAARDALTTAQLLAEPPLRTAADGRFALAVPATPEPDELALPSLQIAAKGMAAIAPPISWKLRPPEPGTETRLRLDTDLGDIVLPEGARLFGRVRDVEGKGIAGVVVTMRDLLDGHRVLTGPPCHAHCRAISNASGIFELPCALANGVAVEFAAKGHLRQLLHGVGAGAPLEVALTPAAGRIAGRIVDEGGAPVGGAIVRAIYERAGTTTRVRSAADGAYELPVEQPGRFRVSAYRPRPAGVARRSPNETAESEVQEAPVANLELVVKAPPTATTGGTLRVQAVAAASGKPVAGFRAVAIWQAYALQNAAYLDYLATIGLNGAAPAAGNELLVKGPGEGESRTGAVRVVAAGCAPATERDVEWTENEADRKPVVVKLVPESTLAGRVVDERTGASIAGATVWAQRKVDRSMGSFGSGNEAAEGAVTTGADGAFALGQLGEGDWVVRFRHAERPAPPVVEVALQAAERKDGLELKLAAGARVGGRITGMPIPVGSKVLLSPIAVPRFLEANHWASGSGRNELKASLAGDGSFAFSGIALANFFVVLELPSPPRGGGSLFVPVEPLRVRPDGVQRDFDATLDKPARIRGSVRFPKAAPTAAVLMVVDELLADDPDQQAYAGGGQFAGPRAFVQADGSFTLPVVRGTHRLRLVDVATGLLLASTAQRIVVPTGGEVVAEIVAPLTELVVQLQPADAGTGPAWWVDRLEVRHAPAVKDERAVMFGGGEEYDYGIGLPVPAGATSLRLWLPDGKTLLYARSSAGGLRRGKERGGMAPLAKEEIEFPAGETARREVVLRLAAPPALDAEPVPANDADAAGVKKN